MAPHPSTTLPIDHCVIFLLGKAFQRVTQAARDRLAAHNVSTVQYVVLSALWERDGQSGAQLTARLRIDSATITGVIDRLVAADLAARVADVHDRRVQRVQLTPKGRALRRPLEKAMIEVNRQIADELGSRAKAFWAMLAEVGAPGGDEAKEDRQEKPKIKTDAGRRIRDARPSPRMARQGRGLPER